MISDALLDKAGHVSPATLHEAAGRTGALPGWIKPLDAKWQLTGRAVPVTCLAGDNLWIHHALYVCKPGDVLVVDCGRDGADYGYWGEVLAIAALSRKLAGLVITGGVRDVPRLIELGFPVFSGSISIRGTTKIPNAAGCIGGTLRIGDALVNGGDLVRGDADGVVIIAESIAEQALAKGVQRDLDEVAYFERIRRGESTLDIYKLPDVAFKTGGKG